MASKTPKAPRKAPAQAKAAPAKPSKAGKSAKGKGRGRGAVVYETVQEEAPAEKGPSFFERLRQRRAERHAARADEWRRHQAERHEALERERLAEEEQRRLREAAEKAEQERLAAEEQARQEEAVAAERKAKAAARREAQRAEKDAEEARKADEAIAQAAAEAAAQTEKERADAEAKARRAAEREAKRRELEEEERRKAEEQARRDAEEAAEREAEERRVAAQERLRKEREAEGAKARKEPRELEPEMEFQEASRPVAAGREMVPKDGAAASGASPGASAVDMQADLMVAELARRRSKPIVLEEDLPAPPTIPKAPLRPGESWSPPPPQPKAEVEFTEAAAPAPPAEAFGFALPEAFLLLANGGQWDERAERNKEGAYGGALAGSLVLELLMAGAIMVQRDRFIPTGTVPDDPTLYAVLERLRRIREKKGDVSSLRQMAELARQNRELLRPYKDSLQMRALARWGERKHLGLFHRSWLQVTDLDVQERLQNRLRRAIAGGGTPEPQSILLLGLLDAVGQFGTVVPDEAADYNRKRLNGLLGGRDIMGYKVHPDLKALQEIAVRTVLANVRLMTVRG